MTTATARPEGQNVAETTLGPKHGPPLVLRLYVAGDAPNSTRARANLARLLSDVDPKRYELEVVDCLDAPARALNDGVLVTPTLVRVKPPPQRTIVGSLSSMDRVADALDLDLFSLHEEAERP
jgi:circadian clock protein KaiB